MHLIEPRRPSEVERTTSGNAEHTGAGPPVAAAKVRIPASVSTVLIRERLHDLMNAAVAGADVGPPVTVVCAPAGAGKTTMLATWARGRADRDDAWVAWVSLDSEDNDPALLWPAILRGLKDAGAWGRDDPLDGPVPTSDGPNAVFLAVLIARLERLPKPVVLVLDGVHDVHSAGAVHTLNMLLRHSPTTLRVVLATRFPPPLILPRLKLEGRLREIGPDELTFTTDEARRLYANEGIQLAEPELELLMERTEGWAAALRLAAITLADSSQPGERITQFTGNDRVVADYLTGEVFARQPKDVQQFMLSTCICCRFTADLAVALSRRDNAGQILDRLERTGIVTVEHDAYRYHPLLGSYLRAELGRRRLSAQQQLHRVAADWFLTSGDALKAMEHSIASGDDDVVTRLVARFGVEQILKGETVRLRRILDSAPAHVLSRPSVALVAALTALDLGDVLVADRWLRGIDNAAHPLRTQRLRALRATVQLHRSRLDGDVGTALTAVRSTRAGRTGEFDLDLLTLFNRGVVAAWTGHHHRAKSNLYHALRLAASERRDAVRLQCEAHLAAVAAVEGDLAQMSTRARGALAIAESRGWDDTPRCTYIYTLLALEAYERLEDERAGRLASLATALVAESTDPTIELFALTLHAMVTFHTARDPHLVVATLRGHWQRLGGKVVAPALVAYTASIQQRMALRVGELSWAAEVLQRVEKSLVPCGEQALAQAILHAHQGRLASTRRLLGPILSGRTRIIVASTVIDAWLLEAHLADRLEDANRAHEALIQALTLAAPHDIMRPFHDAGQFLRALLARGAGRFGRHEAFATKVLISLPASVPDPTDRLTAREQALLAELPSMRTAEEIAHTMFVSVNTVKTHLRGIYRKLGVSHRRDAITVARQRGLL
jgi:LuxR family transcriptional regulator, maltose regulon positive regulatory protein